MARLRDASLKSFPKTHWLWVSKPSISLSIDHSRPHLGHTLTLGIGDFRAEEYSTESGRYDSHSQLGIAITVDEVFDNDHRVVFQKGAHKGRFTFTAADSGDHKICFTTTSTSAGSGWIHGGANAGANIRLNLDLAIGETSSIESADKGKIHDIVQKVKDLNGRLQDIRREQVFQRVNIARQNVW
ncbi:MAG: emp24p/erv25p- protein [Candelina submexicana]|nr:MAG: emp24p/erv25p- protein [Candelina submexicana]